MNINSNRNGQNSLLGPFYHHARANSGLINFVENNDTRITEIRKAKPSCPQNELHALFNKPCWEKISTGKGHAKYKSQLLSGITVGFECHGQDYVNESHLQGIVEKVDTLVNTMFDEVYQRPVTCEEQETPEWNECEERYDNLLNSLNHANNNESNSKTGKTKNDKYLNKSNGTKKFRR